MVVTAKTPEVKRAAKQWRIDFKLVLAANLVFWSAIAVADDARPVKLSRNGLCHERGTSAYAATLHYQPFATLADCIKAGGHAAKSKHAPSPPTMANR